MLLKLLAHGFLGDQIHKYQELQVTEFYVPLLMWIIFFGNMLTCKSRFKAYYNDTVVIFAIYRMQTLPQGTEVWLCLSLHKNLQNCWVKRNQELWFSLEYIRSISICWWYIPNNSPSILDTMGPLVYEMYKRERYHCMDF